MKMSILLVITFMCSFRTISSTSSCSATNSYIQITSPLNLVDTLTSSKALFPPYSYYVPSTDLVTLNTSTDDPCTSLSTDIDNKIVLIFESHGYCSIHYKVYIAQQNGAIAVIIANNDVSGLIIDIPDDNLLQYYGLSTSIPTRSISLSEGTILDNTISSGTIITITFDCYDSLYPTHLCILDTEGDFWYLDGDYQLEERTFNDHSVYKKEGYVYLLPNVYIFQNVMDGDTDWHWTITLDPYFVDDRFIDAQCAVGSISDPSLCPLWNTTDGIYRGLNVSSGLCSVSDSYICITSSESDLRGLDGVYRQFNQIVPFWFRELDDCDSRPGWLLYKYPQFILVDSLNEWIIAQCIVPYPDATLCTHWQSIINDTLIEELRIDNTMRVTQCTAASNTCNPSTTSPDKFCMEKSSVMHSFLEGEYTLTGVVGAQYNTKEYIRSNPLFYDGEYIAVYVWWFGEINPDEHSWWVLSRSNLTDAIAHNGNVPLYAYCESKTVNPTECTAAWNFFFIHAFHPDFHFNAYDGRCTSGQAAEDYLWPDYVCVGFMNDTIGSESEYLKSELFIGGYEINNTGTVLSDGTPHWIKPKNTQFDDEIYLYFDAFFGYWQIGYTLHVVDGSVLICFQEDDYSPIDCSGWYDAWLNQMNNMYLYECSESDMMRISSIKGKSNAGIVVGVVFCFLIVLLLIFGCFYKTRQRGHASFRMETAKETESGINQVRVDSTAGLAKTNFTPLDVNTPELSGDEADFNTEKSGTENTEKMEAVAIISKTSSNQDADQVEDVDDVDDEEDEEEDEEEEKKDQIEQGIDNRRMSAQMVDAMQNTLNEWTSALIEDPKDAARRYSKTSKQDVDKIQKLYKDIMDKDIDDEKKINDDKDEDNKEDGDNKDDIIDDDEDQTEDEQTKNPADDVDDKPAEWTKF